MFLTPHRLTPLTAGLRRKRARPPSNIPNNQPASSKLHPLPPRLVATPRHACLPLCHWQARNAATQKRRTILHAPSWSSHHSSVVTNGWVHPGSCSFARHHRGYRGHVCWGVKELWPAGEGFGGGCDQRVVDFGVNEREEDSKRRGG